MTARKTPRLQQQQQQKPPQPASPITDLLALAIECGAEEWHTGPAGYERHVIEFSVDRLAEFARRLRAEKKG